MAFIIRILTLGVLVGYLTPMAEEWTRFRGPNGTGRASEALSFRELSSDTLAWKKRLPGRGHSSPVGWGGRIFLTGADERAGKFQIMGITAASGDIEWQQEISVRPYRMHRFNSIASSSAAVDAERVYVSWGASGRIYLAAYSHDGDSVWKKDLGSFTSSHGPGTSPFIHGDLLIMANENMDDGFIVALDSATGNIRWQTPRGNTEKTAYSTPCVYQDAAGNPALLVNSFSHGIGALDLRTGAPLWAYNQAFDKRSCSSPVVAGGLIFGSCGSGGGGNYVVAVRPPKEAGAAPELAYEIRQSAPYVPTFLSHGKWLFLVSDNGVLSCVEPVSGKVEWSERLSRFGRYFSSPISVGEEMIVISTAGQAQVLSALGTFRILSEFDLAETCHATPAVLDGHLFIRTLGHLWKFRSTESVDDGGGA